MSRVRSLAIVGLGLIGIRHFRATGAAENATVDAIVDISEEAKAIAEQQGIAHFDSLEQMLESTRPDGVIIATPNKLHVSMAMLCIEAGIPVLIEKPLATDIAEAEQMLRLADSQDVPVLTGYFRRYNPVVSATREQIEQGAIGQIVSVHCHFWLHKHKQYFDTRWRTQEQGGPIHINLAHDVDILLHLVGDIEQVTACQSNHNRKLVVEDTAVVICRFTNGALGTINMSDTIPAPWSWELTAGDNPAYPQTDQSYCFIGGVDGSLEIPRNRIWYYQKEKSWYTEIESKTFMKQVRDPLVAQIEHFGRVITGNEKPLVTGKDGLKVMRVIRAIKQSAQSGQTVSLQAQTE